MSVLINDPSSAADGRLNIFDDPAPWGQVRLAGLLILATVVKFNGLKIEDVWKMQKSKNSSGSTFAYGGTNPVGGEQGFSITWRATGRAEFAQLYDVWNAIAPVPVLGGVGGGSTGTSSMPQTKAIGSPPKPDDATAEQLLAQAQAALASLNSPTPAPSSVDPAAATQTASAPQPSPGPRPPTVPIESAWLQFLGVFACARKWFEFSTIEPDKYEFTIGFIHDSPPQSAGAGAMGAPAPAASVGSGFTSTANKLSANASAAGT